MGVFEECVGIEKDILQSVLIPIANISRIAKDGTKSKEEVLNQSETYIKLFWSKVYKEFSLIFNNNRIKLGRLLKCYIIFIKLKI